jgi:carboxylesterase type B
LISSPQGQTYPKSWNTFVDAVNCTNAASILACVRAISQVNLTSVIERMTIPFRPVIDNYILPAHPETLRQSGQVARVPVMTGSNANEGRLFAVSYLNATLGFTLSGSDHFRFETR